MKEIARRQNEPELLKIQFASRMLFNRAERENYIIWVLCILSALTGFLSADFSSWIAATVIIVAELLAFLLEKKMEKDILLAANLRSIFDRNVFGMPKILSEEATDELYEIAENLALRYHEEYILQTSHTGSDTPPGVKDWYNTNIDIPEDTQAVFLLIKENKWWDAKMVHNKSLVYGVATFIILIPALILVNNLSLEELLVILVGILGLLFRFVERILTLFKYEKLSVKLDGYVERFEDFAPDKGLFVLQDTIEERRQLPIVHCNTIHTQLAKKLQEQYGAIHKERINR